MQSNQEQPKKRLVSFDIICLFSCLCVTLVHFNASVSGYNGTFVYPQNSLIPNFYLEGRIYLGGIGVSLFFMLSGARLMYSYRGVKSFYTKRIMNIYPMFWIAYATATAIDFMHNRFMPTGNLITRLISIFAMDGYLCSLGFDFWTYYKLGEWFLGCILILYIIFPILHGGVERYPRLMIAASIVVYAWGAKRGVNDLWFFMRIPEMMFGMYFVRYCAEKKLLIWLLGCGATFALAWVFRNNVMPLTLCIALGMVLFCLFTMLAKYVKNPRIISALAQMSVLTYPIFLVHHWLIDRMVIGFNLADLPREYIFMLFAIYVVLTLVLAQALNKANLWIMKRMKKTGSKNAAA